MFNYPEKKTIKQSALSYEMAWVDEQLTDLIEPSWE